ncbi:MAG: hypothetical protein V1697_00825 [Candidatus Levyibacteriota bacterium]
MKKVSRRKRTNRLIKKKKIAIIILCLGLLLSIASLVLSYYHTSFYSEPPVSPVSKTKLSEINDLEKLLVEKNIRYSRIIYGDDLSFYVDLNDGGQVIFSMKKKLKDQISSLQLILSRLTIEGKRLKKLDFRFNKPIIELN